VSTHNFHLAQMNIGRVRGPLNDPIMADFVAQLDAINALAEASPGFVWRLQGDGGESSSYLRAYPDPLLLVNLTVWESPEALHVYTYRSDHAAVFRRRKEWFEPSERPTVVLWWLPAGQLPSIEDGKTRLEHLWAHGPTPFAFTFRQQFPQPG
jgi:hypothetical protein